MGLLLDTHIWLWGLLDPDRLSNGVRQALASRQEELRLSPISVWEALILAERGRLTLEPDPRSWLRKAMSKCPIVEVPVTLDVVLVSRNIDLEHQDPADRFIAASAKVFGLKLVTADRRLLRCPEIEVLPNI
ncbi:MAG: type II toxin-antitoxin system VapC family toxin [Acidobacteriota bacterium]|nr:type II toxin-antitoxin system VapC family toxin [Acidobacteriota bacterium]MDE2965035.1 type II toxin-antitoxin system VapC family toxin [Acidobacteriota bacterium]